VNYDLSERKLVGILSTKVTPEIAVNVIGHLSVSIGAHVDAHEIMGRAELKDGSGTVHLGIARYSFIVKTARPSKLRDAISRAKANSAIITADYPKQMLDTGHDDELASALQNTEESGLEYLGAVLFGPAKDIDEVCGRFCLWWSGSGNC
jgi:hypothetical protein